MVGPFGFNLPSPSMPKMQMGHTSSDFAGVVSKHLDDEKISFSHSILNTTHGDLGLRGHAHILGPKEVYNSCGSVST